MQLKLQGVTAENDLLNVTENIDKLIEKGYQSAPILEVDGNFMEYKQAVDWIKNRGKAE